MTAARPGLLLLLATCAAPTGPPTDLTTTPASLYLMVGPGLTTDHAAPFVGFAIDGGVHVAGSWWGHAAARFGSLSVSDDLGHVEFRAGTQARSCSPSGGRCATAGIDLGFQQTTVKDVTYSDALLVPHFAGDVGDEHLRLRVQVELRGFTGTRTDAQGDRATQGIGVGFGAALGYQW
ncbi:MAG: hypothetical protein IPL61_28425 [Myxococcales bacterium]|nr:hypothetical protein [Myxococcales bacterium]